MNEQQCRQLDEQGYLIFKNAPSPVEVESILARLEELWAAALSLRERVLLGLDDE